MHKCTRGKINATLAQLDEGGYDHRIILNNYYILSIHLAYGIEAFLPIEFELMALWIVTDMWLSLDESQQRWLV